jgi:hypothetical protein
MPLAETKEAQEKGGLEIAIVPAVYKAAERNTVKSQPVDPPIGDTLIINTHPGQIYLKETSTPSLQASPNRLQFTVRINNKLSRVFRGQGSVVQFNVGGQLIPFGSIDYKEFINGIVPPRNETELKIFGPTLDMLPDKGTIGIFLYDVVTATDVAGNTTAKQNYEWYFNYTMETVQQSGKATVSNRYVTPAEYQGMLARDQQKAFMRNVPAAQQ